MVTQTVKKRPFLLPTNDSFDALTQCNGLVQRKRQKIPKKETLSKLKITVLRQLDWGTFFAFSMFIEQFFFLIADKQNSEKTTGLSLSLHSHKGSY